MIDTLVIGGGPAGSMVALRLAHAGRAVVLVEKERGPHPKVCGEFLSREAVEYLGQVGIDLRGLGAVPIHRVRLHAGRRMVQAHLPFRAMSLSRSRMDEALLERAQKSGCDVRWGVEVETLSREGGQWRIGIRGGEPLGAKTVFLATGKHEIRGWARSAVRQTDLVGFKMQWRLRPEQIQRLRGVMELFLFRDGYGGMSLVEDDAATLCFVIRRVRLRGVGGGAGVVDAIRSESRSLRERLSGAEALYDRPLAISSIPYGHVVGEEDRGVWCVGDQAAVIPSFTGDGMSIALHSAALAAQMALAGRSVAEFNVTLRAQVRTGMRIATALSQAMVTPVGRGLAPAVLSFLPGGMRWIAAATRIPESALVAAEAWRQVSPA
jgi:flavin-dependent dehydrogenase